MEDVQRQIQQVQLQDSNSKLLLDYKKLESLIKEDAEVSNYPQAHDVIEAFSKFEERLNPAQADHLLSQYRQAMKTLPLQLWLNHMGSQMSMDNASFSEGNPFQSHSLAIKDLQTLPISNGTAQTHFLQAIRQADQLQDDLKIERFTNQTRIVQARQDKNTKLIAELEHRQQQIDYLQLPPVLCARPMRSI